MVHGEHAHVPVLEVVQDTTTEPLNVFSTLTSPSLNGGITEPSRSPIPSSEEPVAEPSYLSKLKPIGTLDVSLSKIEDEASSTTLDTDPFKVLAKAGGFKKPIAAKKTGLGARKLTSASNGLTDNRIESFESIEKRNHFLAEQRVEEKEIVSHNDFHMQKSQISSMKGISSNNFFEGNDVEKSSSQQSFSGGTASDGLSLDKLKDSVSDFFGKV